MASTGGLTGVPLRNNFEFNWLFLVVLVVCGILSLFFLFYFNRLFATLVSYGLRAWTWHRYRVYIDFQALQISLLAGRIFFKGLRYHGNNETIFVHSGYVTWCYWLGTVREVDLSSNHDDKTTRDVDGSASDGGQGEKSSDKLSGAEKGGAKEGKRLPCRLNVSISGAEWFVYNRSAAYDAIVLGMNESAHCEEVGIDKTQSPNSDSKLRKRPLHSQVPGKLSSEPSFEVPASLSSLSKERKQNSTQDDPQFHSTNTMQTDTSVKDDQAARSNVEDSLYLRLLPIHIECHKAAVVLGNENTKSVLITKAERVSGEVDASKALNPLDQYRQMFNFDFEHPVVQIKPNDDYKEDQVASALRVKRGINDEAKAKKPHFYTHSFWHRQRRKAWHRIQDMIPRFRSSVESFSSEFDGRGTVNDTNLQDSHNWQGLSRYLEDGEKDDKARWSSIEYATVTTIADCPTATLSFYWDVAGIVPHHNSYKSFADGINPPAMDPPPEFGLSLSVDGANINYGPWADRQRADLQKVFFPALSKTSTPGKVLLQGQNRVYAEFKIYIELNNQTILRVPIKEESKNWKWTKQADTMGARDKQKKSWTRRRKADTTETSETRPFGWLDVKVGQDATISYVIDMIASNIGYKNNLKLDLPNIEVTTSVNHGLLLRSMQSSVLCDLSNPLQWNGHHTWTFDVGTKGLELFLLREHVFLLIDLVDDWGSGPAPDYLTFTPFKYVANLHLDDFNIFLNVNDANIINNPSDFDDNTFISIFGSVLDAKIEVPLDSYRPARTDISFHIDARDGGLKLHVPPWNTQATLLKSNVIATLNELLVDGSYQYCATTSTTNTDTLILNVHGDSPMAQIYGFVIRYYLKVKDNYFGDDIHFRTLEEYQSMLQARLQGDLHDHSQPPFKKSNDLDIILAVTAENTNARLPANLYSSNFYTNIEIASLALDLRFTNYYMDLDVEFKTLAFSQGHEQDEMSTPNSASSSTELFIDGINIFGNRLFGLPPTEPTYICNWDFTVGAVSGECSTEFLRRLANGGRCVGFSFDDEENALPLIMELVLHDITFLRAGVESIKVWVHVEDSAFLFTTGNLSVNFNDHANSHFSGALKLNIPDIQLACVDAESASRHRSRIEQSVITHMLLQTSLSLTMINRKIGFAKQRQLQQDHIRYHDQRTHRTDFLLLSDMSSSAIIAQVDPPAMCVPLIPVPIINVEDDKSSGASHRSSFRSTRIRRKTSFLSLSSKSQRSAGSVVRARSPIKRDSAVASSQSGKPVPTLLRNGSSRLRDVSASSGGHQSSFYSAVGDTPGIIPASVHFSSSYISPYFPLKDVEPDDKDLPHIRLSDAPPADNVKGLADVDILQYNNKDEDMEHVSLIVKLPSGVRTFLTPKAVDMLACVLTAFQPVEPVDILDSLQMECISEVLSTNKKMALGSKTLDISVHSPGISVRFLDASEDTLAGTGATTSDQYDLLMSGLKFSTRSKELVLQQPNPAGIESHSAMHFTTESISFGAKERYENLKSPKAVSDIVVTDILFWMAASGERSVNLSFRDLEFTTITSKIEYLASMIHRTETTTVAIIENFTSRLAQQANRLQLFAHLITSQKPQISEPLFLSRPSYVLRSAENHLRVHDTWKVLARLRHVHSSVDVETRQDLIFRCLNDVHCPLINAKQDVLVEFDRWRSWDVKVAQDCIVLRRIFGSETAPDIKVSSSKPVTQTKATFSSRSIRLLLDPGPKQNELSLYAFTATAESRPMLQLQVDGLGPEEVPTQNTTVQVNCPDISIVLNWELYELADDVLKLIQSSDSVPSQNGFDVKKEEIRHASIRHDVHFFVATDNASVTLDTINLTHTMASRGMKGSFVLAQTSASQSVQMTTLMLAADSTESSLISHSQDLMTYRLTCPSIFLSQENDSLVEHRTSTFKVAANSRELEFLLRQEIPTLIEVADLVLGDEIEQIDSLIKRIPKQSTTQIQQPQLPQSASNKQTSSIRINVALFLGEYFIRIALLHGLVYEVNGVVARASIASKLGSEVILDFDIKENLHELRSSQSDASSGIAALAIPPTNGRVTSHMSDEDTTISIYASVEPIILEAVALQGLTTAFNRPEITGIVSDVKEDINALQGHIEEIFGSQKQSLEPPPGFATKTPLIYDAHITWAGLNVSASSPGNKDENNSAKLDFKLGCVQLTVANRLDLASPILEYPEIRVGLRHIGLELIRKNNNIAEPCGSLICSASLTASSRINEIGNEVRSFHVQSDGLKINLYPNTASSVVDIMSYLQDKLKDLDFRREKKYLRKLRNPKPRITISDAGSAKSDVLSTSTFIFAAMYSLEILNIQISWIVGPCEFEKTGTFVSENLVLSLKRIELSTRKENSARLTLTDLQLQMVPENHDPTQRSFNSALLPEVIFNVGYVSTPSARRLAFQAAGKSLDLRLTSQFILPASQLQKSIYSAVEKVRHVSQPWMSSAPEQPVQDKPRKPFFGKKRMESLLVDADFAGAIVHLSGKTTAKASSFSAARIAQGGRYGHFSQTEADTSTTLRSPGLAWKIEYTDNGLVEPALNAEVKVDASNNILYPAVVPLIIEISSAIKEIVSDDNTQKEEPAFKSSPQKLLHVEDENILAADPSVVLGRTRLNLGLKICRQEFSLSCQPIARVAAVAKFEDIYMTINTVRSTEHGHFFAATAAFTKLQVSVQHVYSRESTGSFDVESVFLSLMNSKHVSGTSGLSAILKISPMKVLVNAKQLQDFLLFRDIWVPPELRQKSSVPAPAHPTAHNQPILVQRYQQVAATGAFPWNAAISIAELDVQLDLGQAIGKSAFIISNFWVSSKKNSDWEQNLCLGFDKVGVDSTGRMSGFVALQDFKLRTSIRWPAREMALNQTPLVQGSLDFSQFRVKAAFDYQAFLIADITSFKFLMYNVRQQEANKGDRLVAILDGEAVQVFCTATSASQGLALYQAFQRLIQEKRTNYQASLAEIEKFMRRKSVANLNLAPMPKAHVEGVDDDEKASKSPISLHTNVIVTLKALNIGAFPNTFADHQVFKLEALNAQARFAVVMDEGKIHSILDLTLGQLRIGLARVSDSDGPKTVGDLRVEDVVRSATGSRGGTILKVPKVQATMQTWQTPNSNHIDYIFKSSFEGKVEVGWNYSRISYIRNMWATHSKALALKLGKPLPQSAVKITGVPGEEGEENEGEQKKITAEVNVPLSKYDYTALEPAIIETPQLRDMGEATPPLEWIGLHRERLPNLTHQIVIVTLLEVASEVEEAYGKILGSS